MPANPAPIAMTARSPKLTAHPNSAGDFVLLLDEQLRIDYASPGCARLAGRSSDWLRGRKLWELPRCGGVWGHWAELAQSAQDQGGVSRGEHRSESGDQRFDSVASWVPESETGGQIVLISQDVTQRRAAEAERVRNEERFDRALTASALGLWDWDVTSGRIYFDPRCLDVLGQPDNFRGHLDELLAITHPDDADRARQTISDHLGGASPYYELEWRARTQDGNYRWVCSTGQVTMRSEDGIAQRVTGTVRDIHEQKQTAEHLQSANQQIHLLLQATDEGMMGLTAEGICTFVNPSALEMLDLSEADLLGKRLYDVIQHSNADGHRFVWAKSPVHRCLRDGVPHRAGDETFHTGEHRQVPVDYSIAPLVTNGKSNGAVLAFRDVSDRRSLARKLQFQAIHDPLTGLVNRRGFDERLREMLVGAKRWKREHALLYMDLDHFKVVNDACGHSAGDELLRSVAGLLRKHVRARDTVARLGSDEFAVLLEDCPMPTATRIAYAIRDEIRDYRFEWEMRRFSVGVSIGATHLGADSEDTASVISAADTCCHLAKEQGQNHVHVSLPDDMAVAQRRGEIRWIAKIKQALEENRFRLFFQSIVSADEPDLRATSHEVLLRLFDEDGQMVSPAEFIPAAERYQLMPSIDRWVVVNLLRDLGERLKREPQLRNHRFGVNLSGETLRDTELLDITRKALAEHDVPPDMIYFEVTETSAIANLGAALEFMRGVKALGCKLALDDFGSGMSSFSYLKTLPVDYLKIDGSFVRDVLSNPVDREIVEAINAVARRMGISTIAEFVETREICDCLKQMGVQFAQGFAFAKPTPLNLFDSGANDALPISA